MGATTDRLNIRRIDPYKYQYAPWQIQETPNLYVIYINLHIFTLKITLAWKKTYIHTDYIKQFFMAKLFLYTTEVLNN